MSGIEVPPPAFVPFPFFFVTERRSLVFPFSSFKNWPLVLPFRSFSTICECPSLEFAAVLSAPLFSSFMSEDEGPFSFFQ